MSEDLNVRNLAESTSDENSTADVTNSYTEKLKYLIANFVTNIPTITDLRVMIFIVYSFIFVAAGFNYLATDNCLGRTRDDWCAVGAVLIWLLIGFLGQPIAIVNTIRLTDNLREATMSYEHFTERPVLLNKDNRNILILYGSFTYFVVLILTRITGETGYWI